MNWLQIKNNADQSIDELFIYGEIGDWWEGLDATSLAEKVKNSTGDTIKVRINSGGGNVFTALSLYSLLKTSGKKVVAHVDGICASAATFLACAAESVIMTLGGQFMIHDPLTDVYGNAKELRKTADLLDQVGGSIAMLYAEKTGHEINDILDKMNAETWMNATEAKDYGFVSEILETAQLAATTEVINMAGDRFKNIPKNILNTVKSVKTTKEVSKTMDLAQFKAEHKPVADAHAAEIRANVQAEIKNAVDDERQRIKNIMDSTPVGHEKLAQDAIDNGLSAGDFAIKALKAEKDKLAEIANNSQNDRQVLNDVQNTPTVVEKTDAEKEKEQIDNFFNADFANSVNKGVK